MNSTHKVMIQAPASLIQRIPEQARRENWLQGTVSEAMASWSL